MSGLAHFKRLAYASSLNRGSLMQQTKAVLTRLAICAALFAPAGPAAAQTVQTERMQAIVERLQTEGYTVTDIRRSWLGRIVVVAQTDQALREVVVNRTSGEILRDRLFARETDDNTETTQNSGSQSDTSPTPSTSTERPTPSAPQADRPHREPRPSASRPSPDRPAGPRPGPGPGPAGGRP